MIPIRAGLVVALCFLLIGVGCSKEADSKQARLSRANEYFASDQYEAAEREYREVLRLDPSQPEALRQLGIIYQEQGQWVQSYPFLKKLAELEPTDPLTQAKYAHTLVALGQFAEAREAALLALDKEPGQEQALIALTDTALPTNSAEETRSIIESRLSQDRDRSAYHLALGMLALRQKNEQRAESELKAALDLDAKSSAARLALGTLHLTRKDLKSAAQEFKAAAELAPMRSPVRMRYVDFLLGTGAEAEAKAILEDLNRKLPDYLPPRVYMMRMTCNKERAEDCAARVQNILAQDSINYDALFQDGLLNLAKGDTTKAIREFEQLSSIYSKNAQARYQLALAYLQFAQSGGPNAQKAIDSAETNLSTAVTLSPHFAPAVLSLAELKIRKGAAAAAVNLLVPIVKSQPRLAQAHHLLASAYLAQKNDLQALIVYRQMAELFPQDPQPLFFIGRLLLAQRKTPEAKAAFEKASEMSPNYLPVIEQLVELDLAEKKFDSAIARVQGEIARNPNFALPLAIRGRIYFARRDFAEGERDLLRAIEIDSNLESAHLLLARLYIASDRPERAIQQLNEFSKRNKTVSALQMLAEVQERIKNFSGARDAYEQALAIAPSSVPALNNLAVIYAEHLDQLDKAYDLAKKARDVNSSDPHLADTLGWILFKKSDYRTALQLLQESAIKLPDQPEIQFHLGMAHYMLGQDEPARVALQRAVDSTATFSAKEEARRRLAILALSTEGATPTTRTVLDKYLSEMPNDPAALFRLGQLQEKDGAVDEAIKTYGKIVERNPLFAPALRRQAITYGPRIDDPKTFDVVTKARQAYPDDPEIAKWLGVQNYRREYYVRAADLLREAAIKRSDDPEVLYYLGEAQRQIKQWADCKASIERALTLNLVQALAEKAKAALNECSEATSP